MDPLVLTSQVVREDSRYVARVEQLALEGSGESVQEAQDELIKVVRSWIEIHDGRDDLEQALAQAGFPGVEEHTELHLEFVE